MKFKAPDLQAAIEAIPQSKFNETVKKANQAKKKRDEESQSMYLAEISAAYEEYDIEPKQKATQQELKVMIGMVLDSGDSGTKVIRQYAAKYGKNETWAKEIAKPNASKSFETALDSYDQHVIVISMQENDTYCKKDILNNSVTGALTKLSKQVNASKVIDSYKLKIQELEQQLAIQADLLASKSKSDIEGWALELRKSGMSLRKVEDITGVKRGTIDNRMKKQQAK